jgi:GMP synthase-like glutamine amidotransferase
MNIGLLQCDAMCASMQLEFGNCATLFQHLLTQTLPTCSIVTYRADQGQLPLHPTAHHAYLISGSHHSVNDGAPWIEALCHFLRTLQQTQIKTIGICFGHQLIAKAFGGQVAASQQGWAFGVQTYQILTQPQWMQTTLSDLRLIASHEEQVVSLPPDATVLASHPACPYAMFMLQDQFVGIQGHPEFTPEYVKKLVLTGKYQIPSGTVQAGLQSLATTIDNQQMGTWLNAFLNSGAQTGVASA